MELGGRPALASTNCKFVSPAIKLSHQGKRSRGILVMVRKNMSSFVQEIGVQYHNIVLLKLSKKAFGCDRDIMYIATYIPPPGNPFYDCLPHNRVGHVY